MGCCLSRESGAGGNDNPPVPDSSRTHITAPSQDPSIASPRGSHASPSKGAPPAAPPNQPLVALDPDRHSTLPNFLTFPSSTRGRNPAEQRWTRAKLEEERQNWWDSQTSGEKSVWLTYRRMVKCLQEDRLADAQANLDAANLTCPDGRLWHGIYDVQGRLYNIREGGFDGDWLVWEPIALAPDTPDEGSSSESLKDTSSDDAPLPSHIDKGKGKAEDMVTVRCRMPTGMDYTVQISWDDDMASITRKLRQVANDPQLHDKRLVVTYLGRVFGDYEKLPKHGPAPFKPGNVLTIMIMDAPP